MNDPNFGWQSIYDRYLTWKFYRQSYGSRSQSHEFDRGPDFRMEPTFSPDCQWIWSFLVNLKLNSPLWTEKGLCGSICKVKPEVMWHAYWEDLLLEQYLSFPSVNRRVPPSKCAPFNSSLTNRILHRSKDMAMMGKDASKGATERAFESQTQGRN